MLYDRDGFLTGRLCSVTPPVYLILTLARSFAVFCDEIKNGRRRLWRPTSDGNTAVGQPPFAGSTLSDVRM